MNFRYLFVLIFICSAIAVAENKQQRADDLWTKAQQVNAFSHQTLPPYHLIMKFVLRSHDRQAIDGEIRKDYLDDSHYRYELSSPKYQRFYVRNGDNAWESEQAVNIEFDSLLSNIPPIHYLEAEQKPVKVFDTKFRGVALSCIKYEKAIRFYCFDTNGLMLLRETELGKVLYSRFVDFSGKKVPLHIELLFRDGRSLVAEGMIGLAQDLRQETFAPRPNLDPVPVPCNGATFPKLKSSPDPKFPKGGIEGIVRTRIIVGIDGTVRAAKVIGPLTPANDQEALRTVQKWKFNPSICQEKPHETVVYIDIVFKKYMPD